MKAGNIGLAVLSLWPLSAIATTINVSLGTASVYTIARRVLPSLIPV